MARKNIIERLIIFSSLIICLFLQTFAFNEINKINQILISEHLRKIIQNYFFQNYGDNAISVIICVIYLIKMLLMRENVKFWKDENNAEERFACIQRSPYEIPLYLALIHFQFSF